MIRLNNIYSLKVGQKLSIRKNDISNCKLYVIKLYDLNDPEKWSRHTDNPFWHFERSDKVRNMTDFYNKYNKYI